MHEAAPFQSIFTNFSTYFYPSPLDLCYYAACPSLLLSFCTHLAGKGGLRHPDVCRTGSLCWQQLPAHHRGAQTGSKNVSVQFNF